MYKNCKVYGPYKRKDGREHIILIFNNKIRKTISYPKYLIELSLKRYLYENETVHHKDGDYTNNNLDNLEIINRSDHAYLHSIKYTKDIEVTCVQCGKLFKLNPKQQRTKYANRNRVCKEFFCSKSCSGKYGKNMQEKVLRGNQ